MRESNLHTLKIYITGTIEFFKYNVKCSLLMNLLFHIIFNPCFCDYPLYQYAEKYVLIYVNVCIHLFLYCNK